MAVAASGSSCLMQEVERAYWGGWEAFEISSLSPVKNAFSELTIFDIKS